VTLSVRFREKVGECENAGTPVLRDLPRAPLSLGRTLSPQTSTPAVAVAMHSTRLAPLSSEWAGSWKMRMMSHAAIRMSCSVGEIHTTRAPSPRWLVLVAR